MGLRSEKLHDLSLEDGKEMIMGLLSGEDDISVIVEKHGATVRVAVMRSYDPETTRILEEAREDYRQHKARGYSREDAFADLEAVQDELRNLSQTSG